MRVYFDLGKVQKVLEQYTKENWFSYDFWYMIAPIYTQAQNDFFIESRFTLPSEIKIRALANVDDHLKNFFSEIGIGISKFEHVDDYIQLQIFNCA